MKTIEFKILSYVCVSLCLLSPASAVAGEAPMKGWAPEKMISIKARLTATKATYKSDLGTDTLNLTQAKFRKNYTYTKISNNTGRFTYTNDRHGSEVYSGTFDLTFKSPTKGRWVEKYTGSYKGTTSGTFRIISLDIPDAPVAKKMGVKVTENKAKTFRLRAKGADIPNNKLRYRIIRKPKVGKLVGEKGLKLTYTPKRGFTGNVTFKYVVLEGKNSTRSRPATVTLRVVKNKVKTES